MTDPNGRVQIIESPVAEPGTCFMCRVGGGVDSRKFVDFGVQFDWYGQVIFCEYCIASVAEAVGFVNKLELDDMREVSNSISVAANNLSKENKVLKNAMASLCSGGAIDGNFIQRALDRAVSNYAHEGTSSGDDEGESKADESGSKQGSKRVRSTTGTKSAS